MKPPVNAIIFDLGGVLIDIDPTKTINRYRELGIRNIDEVYQRMTAQGWFERLERGEVSKAKLDQALRQASGTHLSDEAIHEAWLELLGPIPKERIQMVEALQPKYPLYLLSNTNVPHMEAIHKYVQQTFGKPNMGAWFQKAYYSFDLGMRKPEERIFNHVLTDARLEPHSTLLVDDTKENIIVAQNLGLQAIHIRPNFPVQIALKNLIE